LAHYDEIGMYEDLEDDYECSGMCKKSLFYFGLDLHNGIPGDTCLVEFKIALSSIAGVFGTQSILTGVLALFMFFAHFGLYCRPVPANRNLNMQSEL